MAMSRTSGPNIGDLVPKSGIYTNPGVVVDKKEDGTVSVDTDPMAINKYHRYTNTSGLNEVEKDTFNRILDEIYQARDNDVDKINDIQNEIDRMKTDPANRNVVQYLRNQQSFLIRKAQGLPRTYNTDGDKIRS
jgi:hypothetical protein